MHVVLVPLVGVGPEKRDYRQLGIWQIPHDDKRTSRDLAHFSV